MKNDGAGSGAAVNAVDAVDAVDAVAAVALPPERCHKYHSASESLNASIK